MATSIPPQDSKTDSAAVAELTSEVLVVVGLDKVMHDILQLKIEGTRSSSEDKYRGGVTCAAAAAGTAPLNSNFTSIREEMPRELESSTANENRLDSKYSLYGHDGSKGNSFQATDPPVHEKIGACSVRRSSTTSIDTLSKTLRSNGNHRIHHYTPTGDRDSEETSHNDFSRPPWRPKRLNDKSGGTMGRSYICSAAERRRLAVSAALSAGGVGLDCRYGDTHSSVLDMAAVNGFVDVIREVIYLGAKVDAATPDGRTALHCASHWDQPTAVNALIKYGADVEAQDSQGWTPLHVASAAGSSGAIVALVQCTRTDMNKLDHKNRPPIHLAAEHGRLAVASALISCNVDAIPHYSDDDESALDLAASGGHWGALNAMIRPGASVKATNSDGVSPLYLAALNDEARAVDVLIDAGADIDAQENRGWTPLHAASAEGSSQAVNALLERGADINKLEGYCRAALHLAALNGHAAAVTSLLNFGANAGLRVPDFIFQYSALDMAAANGQLDVLRAMSSLMVNVNGSDFGETTALHVAARLNQADSIDVLVELNANVEAQDSLGWTPMHAAASNNSYDAIVALARHGCDTNKLDVNGRTPLYLAAENSRVSAVKALLATGADPGLRCASGDHQYTVLEMAASKEDLDVLRAVIDQGVDVNVSDADGIAPLSVAARCNRPGAINMLARARANVNAQDIRGCTPLHVAAANNSYDAITALSRNGANLNMLTNEGRPPLLLAAECDCLGAVKTLLAAGADDNLRCGDDEVSPLEAAATEGYVDIIKAMIEHGVDVNSANSEGNTALITAVCCRQARAVDALAEAGADVEACTSYDSWTPLHIASENLHPDVVLVLLKHGADANAMNVDSFNDTPLHLSAEQAGSEGAEEVVGFLLEWDADETATNDFDLTPKDLAPVDFKSSEVTAEDPWAVVYLLTRAPSNRAWGRRGLLVLCYARCKKEISRKRGTNDMHAEGLARSSAPSTPPVTPRYVEEAKALMHFCHFGNDGRIRDTAGNFDVVTVTLLLDLHEEGLFRTIVGFL